MQREYQELIELQPQQDMKVNSIERWMEHLLIRGSNQAKYETFTKEFVSQYFLGNNKYPTFITTATDALSKHNFFSW